MSASYPGAVKTFATKNNGDTLQAAHINDLQDEVNAIESGLLTGTAAISASNASFATLSVSGNSTLASTIAIGTVPYIFPSSGGVTGHVLTIDSTGGSTLTLAWKIPGSPVIDRQSSLVTVANTTTATDVYTFTVPSNTIGSNKTLHLMLLGDHLINDGSADSVKAVVKYGASTVFSGTVAAVNNGANRGALRLEAEISGAGVTNAQRAWGEFRVGDSAQNNAGGVGADITGLLTYMKWAANNNLAEDASTTKNLVVTFQCGRANALVDMRVHTVYAEIK